MKHLYLAATAAIVIAVPAQAQVIGVASAVKNDVRVRKPGAPIARPVQLKQRIAIADTVQTGAKSQMQVVLLDRSIFTVGANARVTIDRYVYDPARNSRTMGATVGRGSFRFLSGRRTTGSTTINTPVAAIGVRGTIVEGVVGEDAVLIANGERGVGRGARSDPEGASLIILRGPGRATTANVLPGVIDVTSGGRTVTVDRPMLAVYVPYEGATPIGPFTISDAGLRQVQALLQPSLAPRLGIDGPIDPDRTYSAPPDFGEQGGAGQRGYPRGPIPGGEGGGEDGPPGTQYQTPGLPGGLQPSQPQSRQRPQSAPTPTPAPLQSPTPTPAPVNRVAPNDNVQQPVGKTPTPLPTPAPSPSLKAAPPPQQSPAFVAPKPSPTPAPTPTPSPNQKPPGKTPG